MEIISFTLKQSGWLESKPKSDSTDIDIPTLKYLARHADRPQLVFFTAIMPATVQLGLLAITCFVGVFWLGPADPTHCSCSSSLLAAYKPNETFKVQL